MNYAKFELTLWIKVELDTKVTFELNSKTELTMHFKHEMIDSCQNFKETELSGTN